jgi:NAD(P)-dependent dehydrogenase (short-subunit alcohol dehydrogenase family)
MSTWLITGASRGLGAHIAHHALAAGHNVVATARKAEAVTAAPADADPGRLLACSLNVHDPAHAHAAVAAAQERFGRVDVVVNNAGRGLLGAVEEISHTEARAVFDTNVFGTLNVLRAVMPGMRARRSGHVINISSVGGFAASPGWGIYNATKFAVEGFSEALAQETAHLGIKVTIVEPGYFRTDFLDSSSLHRGGRTLPDYALSAGTTRQAAHTRNHQQPGDPARAAQAIVALAGHADPPLRLQLGPDCVERVEKKLADVQHELDRWRPIAVATNSRPDS